MGLRTAIVALFLLAAGTFAISMPVTSAERRPAPDFAGITQWLNSEPLSIAGLRGKVVMVNFWTYACYNCANTVPHVNKLHDAYHQQGLVIVGVHTPEFPFERSTGSVRAAIGRFEIKYPVAQDNAYATWNAYRNQYWPAQYIIDRSGNIVYTHAGEGDYATIDRTIRSLLDGRR